MTRIAIVTGSSSGIGEGLARRLSTEGWQVVLNGFGTVEAGAALADELGNAAYFDADVSDPDAARRLVAHAVSTFGGLDLLVNNAGIARQIPHADLDAVSNEFWDAVMDVNLKGPWNMIKAARPHLAERSGQVINMASIAGLVVAGSSVPYAVSKAGVAHMTPVLAKALGPQIRVNAIAPAYIDTPLTHDWHEVRETVMTTAPARRLGAPEDVADVMMGLIAMDYVTGAVLPVDGGLRLV
jgi:ketoreductase RED2